MNLQNQNNNSAADFITALGYKSNAKIQLRAFKSRDDLNEIFPQTWVATPAELVSDSSLYRELQKANESRGIYVVVNSGGATNDEITKFNALFVEKDELSLREQHALLDESPIPTSARLETKKSVHAYFFLNRPLQRDLPVLQQEKREALNQTGLTEKKWFETGDGVAWKTRWNDWLKTPEGENWHQVGALWRDLQTRIIDYFGGDKSIKNEARVMRLPSFNHVSFDESAKSYNFKPVEIVQLDENQRYAIEDLQRAFPAQARAGKQSQSKSRNNQGDHSPSIEAGKRNATLLSLVGQMRTARMSETAILAAALAENEVSCKPPLSEAEVRDICSRYSHQAVDEETIEWMSVPKPLDLALRPVEMIDDDCLPQILTDWLRPAEKIIGCPFDFLVLSAITSAGSIIGSRLRVAPQQHSEWFVVPNLYAGIVGLPSTKKTPALDETRKPILELQCTARDEFELKKADFEIEAKWFEKESGKSLKESKDKNEFKTRLAKLTKPIEPLQKRYEVGDITTPKLVQILSENPNGLALFRDELTGWFKSLEADYDKSARAFYLELSKGAATYPFSRVDGRETLLLSATLSIIGGVQPSKLQRYVAEAYSFDNSDGFLQRFVFSYPDAAKRKVKTKPTEADQLAYKIGFKSANNFFKQLSEHEFGGGIAGSNGDVFRAVKFSTEAQVEIDRWQDEIESAAEDLQNEDEAFSAFLYKFPKNCFAICLIFHCLEGSNLQYLADEIPLSTTLKALAYTDVLISHARRVFALGENQIFVLAQMLLGKIRKGDLPQGFKAREITRKQWSGLKSPETVKDILSLLVDYGYLKAFETNDGRPTTLYFFHPSLEAEIEQ